MDRNEEHLDALLRALGREIRANRVRLELSREELGHRADVATRQIGKMERGERGQLAEAWRVAIALGLSFSQLVKSAEDRVDHEVVSEALSKELAARLLAGERIADAAGVRAVFLEVRHRLGLDHVEAVVFRDPSEYLPADHPERGEPAPEFELPAPWDPKKRMYEFDDDELDEAARNEDAEKPRLGDE